MTAVMTEVLTELTSIANSAATAHERDQRARPVLANAGLSTGDVWSALADEATEWNVGKALEFQVSAEEWQTALQVSGLADVDTVDALLRVLHKAETAARMIKAGYQPEIDGGRVFWTR